MARMNERDREEFINDPGGLFVRQCEELWHEMWVIGNDGERSMKLRKTADAISRYIELPGIYDKASTVEREAMNPILMTIWSVITQPLEDYPELPTGPLPPAVDRVAKCASELMDMMGALGSLATDENALLALSLKVCANMAWQLPKPPGRRQPTLQ